MQDCHFLIKSKNLKEYLKVQFVARNVLLHACRKMWNAMRPLPKILRSQRLQKYAELQLNHELSELQLVGRLLELTGGTPSKNNRCYYPARDNSQDSWKNLQLDSCNRIPKM